jgi:hypothetical protein
MPRTLMILPTTRRSALGFDGRQRSLMAEKTRRRSFGSGVSWFQGDSDPTSALVPTINLAADGAIAVLRPWIRSGGGSRLLPERMVLTWRAC